MIVRLKLVLTQEEYSALLHLAVYDLRNVSEQAHFMIRQNLENRGLLEVNRWSESRFDDAALKWELHARS